MYRMPNHRHHYLHLDFETFSTLDLRVVGAYRYAEHESTEVLMAAYSLDDGPIRQWQPHLRREIPRDLVSALSNNDVFIVAHNAEFERRILIECLAVNVQRARYRCTAARAAAAGLPRSLDGALAALGHPIRKDPRGAAALRKFSRPRKPTKNNPATRLRPQDDPETWQVLLEYNAQDIVAEKALDEAIPDLTTREWRYFQYTAKVNDRGLPLDLKTLEGAAKVSSKLEQTAKEETVKITGCNPTQVAKIRDWLAKNKCPLPNLQLKTIETALREGGLPSKVATVLALRLEASRASTKKIKAMREVACESGRAHGTILYYGAHTGRFSGKLIQPHNFPRGLLSTDKKEQAAIASMVLDIFGTGDADLAYSLLWHNPPPKISGPQPIQGPMSMLAQSMRGFIRAPNGMWFVVADYAAIEARILAWLANETKLIIAFRNKVDTYKMMASVLYDIPVDQVNSEQRRIGKNLRLGAGYQLGPPRLIEHCEKEEIFIDLEFARKAIKAFRDDNRNTVKLWYDSEDAAIRAMQTGKQIQVTKGKNYFFEPWRDWLLMVLPSGRRLHYYAPKVETVVKFGKPKLQLSYSGYDKGRIVRTSTYGGKLIENAVQSIARDVLMEGMLSAEEAGYPVLASIHDEIVTLRKEGEGSAKELEQVICKMPRWAQEIPLGAEGFVCHRYTKG